MAWYLYILGGHVHKYLHPTKGLVASARVSTDFIISQRLGLTPKVLSFEKGHSTYQLAHKQEEGWIIS